MILRPPIFTRPATLFPYTTLFRSQARGGAADARDVVARGVVEAAAQVRGQQRGKAVDRAQRRAQVVRDAVRERRLQAVHGGQFGPGLGQLPRHCGRLVARGLARSEERRVGKACVRTCRSWGSPSRSQKKIDRQTNNTKNTATVTNNRT